MKPTQHALDRSREVDDWQRERYRLRTRGRKWQLYNQGQIREDKAAREADAEEWIAKMKARRAK